jgi:phenylpyruvate tautomerase PptA (4-oxalocrotonate tautomerase family)
MTNRQRLFLFTGIAGASLIGATTQIASAHFGKPNETELASSLAKQLNVSSDSVSSALKSYQSDQQAARSTEMRTAYETRLTEAVTAGKLTEEQKAKLLAKQTELQTALEKLRTEQQALMSSAESWAKDAGIDSSWLQPEGRGFGGPRHR